MLKRRRGQPADGNGFIPGIKDVKEAEDREKLLSVVRSVKGSGKDVVLSDEATPPGRLDQAGQTGSKIVSDKESPKEAEQPEWEPEIEAGEVLDDPVRMYLREIGRVHLLTSKDEKVLARKMEAGRHLIKLEKELTEREGRPPKAWECCHALLHRLIQASPLLKALGENLGLPSYLTLSQITDHSNLQAAIDDQLNPRADGLSSRGPKHR